MTSTHQNFQNKKLKFSKNGWRIFFQDEVGFQREGTLSHTWGKKGEKTEIKINPGGIMNPSTARG